MSTNPQELVRVTLLALLDLVFRNEEDMITNMLYLPPLGNSDHICIQFDLLHYLESKKTDNSIRYNTRAANIDQMKQSLSNVDWISLLETPLM